MSREKTPKGPLPSLIPSERPGQAGGKRDRNRRRRTQALLDGALTLFLERGVESVTIDEIARAAEMAKGSFYRYFRDKNDLIEGLVSPIADRIDAALERCEGALDEASKNSQLFAAYSQLGLELASVLRDSPQILLLYLQENRAPRTEGRAPIVELAQRTTQRAIDMTYAARRHGLLRDLDPQVSTLVVVGAIERLLHAHLRGELEVDTGRAIQDLISLVLEGMVSGS